VALVAPPWFDVPPDGYGGIEQMCAALADGLVGRGHDVTLVAAGEDGTTADLVRTFDETPAGLGTSEGAAVELVHAARARAELEDLDLDVVHDHTFAGPLVAHCRDVPTVVTTHGPIPERTAQLYEAVPDLSLVAISEAQRRARPDLPWIATVYNGIDASTYPYVEDKGSELVFLGRMHPDKGVHLAIEVARAAGRRLVIAAKCSEALEQAYFAEEVEPRLGPDVRYLGAAGADEKRALLSNAAAMLFPIQWEEPFGLVMTESLACGTPVIALRRGSVPEVLVNGETGFVCESLDDMAAAVERLGDIEPRACRDRVLERFDDSIMTERYEAVYRAIASGRRGRPDDVAVTG
jgi:glycosyltransferase involved in cell wall biosynthesis